MRKSFENPKSRVKVEPFGSFVSGLSIWNSDVDLVVTGLAVPSRITGGFSQADKPFVSRCLERIASQLRRCDFHSIDSKVHDEVCMQLGWSVHLNCNVPHVISSFKQFSQTIVLTDNNCLQYVSSSRTKRLEIRKLMVIRTARIPIIKLQTASAVTADVSLGDESGPRAARYVAQQIAAYPPLAPLTLVLKVQTFGCLLDHGV